MRIIAGLRRGMKLAAPPGRGTRPVLDRIKQAWFDVIGDRVVGARVLDAFAGVGSLGLEALSRGAAHCVFIERSPECLELLRRHVARCAFGASASVRASIASAELVRIAGGAERFDLVFLDPPFEMARDSRFYATGGIMDVASKTLRAGGAAMLRRERQDEGDEAVLVPSLRLADRRRWGRSEVLFYEPA